MSAQVEKPDLDALRSALQSPLATALRAPASLDAAAEARALRVEYLCEPKDVEDDPTKLLVMDPRGHKLAVVLVSSPVEPDLVGRGMRIAREARERLGAGPLQRVILEPLGEGLLQGLSYTILPYRPPLGEGPITRRLWRRFVRQRVFDWVAGVSEATFQRVPESEIADAIDAPLRHLAALETMDDDIREAADVARGRFERGDWAPLRVFMHGDLWEDNLLRSSDSLVANLTGPDPPFVVIDWPGATMSGYPIYDLLRIARSMRLGPSGLRREVARHRRLLDMNEASARGHLLACLGHIGLDLGCFPMDMYVAMSRACFADLDAALGPDAA